MSSSRLAQLHAHLTPGSTHPCLPTVVPAAGLLKWVSGLLGGGGSGGDGSTEQPQPVAVADHASHPGQSWGHVHPDIVQTADGTLVIVHAIYENDSPGNDVLVCTRSRDNGASWSPSVPIDCTRFSERPKDAIPELDGTHEVYPGTLTMLPGDRILCTWDYYQSNNVPQGRALMYTISEDQGASWGESHLIFDPNDPPDASLDENQHLGTLRHSILLHDDGRWMLPLTVAGNRSLARGALGYPGVQLYDPQTGSLEAVPALSPGREGCHPALEHPILMVTRSTTGALLAMGKGNSGHNLKPPELPSAAPVLYSPSWGEPWTEVAGFPANVECPPGVAPEEWDDDGDRWGRDVIALSDGRLLAVWVVAGDRSEPSRGMHYCISREDGKTWDAESAVTILADTMIVGRYYQPKTIQLDDDTLGTVFIKGPQSAMEGIFFVKVPLAMLT